jgi:ABC-2 type transport system ATP-binding protein
VFRALKPLHERQSLGRNILLFDRAEHQRLAGLGDVRRPSISDLYLAIIGDHAQPRGAAQ